MSLSARSERDQNKTKDTYSSVHSEQLYVEEVCAQPKQTTTQRVNAHSVVPSARLIARMQEPERNAEVKTEYVHLDAEIARSRSRFGIKRSRN